MGDKTAGGKTIDALTLQLKIRRQELRVAQIAADLLRCEVEIGEFEAEIVRRHITMDTLETERETIKAAIAEAQAVNKE